MRRALLAALLVPALMAAPASAKTKKVCKTVKVHGHKKKRCHRVKVKPVRLPISANVLDGSTATLDFGDGTPRTVGLAGKLNGYVAGKIHLGTKIAARLTSGTLSVTPTDFFSDGCASPVWARSDPATAIRLDPSKVNTATLNPDGSVLSTASVIIRAVLDTRPQNACDQPLLATGYTDSPVTVSLHGQVGQGGLTSLQLGSDPYPLTLNACFTPGDPGALCAGTPVAYPTTATVSLRVQLNLSP
jgi:hypothetical protein